jgi:hypothetical protein
LDERIILQQIIKKRETEAWTGLIWLRMEKWRDLLKTAQNLRVP